jgi:hypothetical protein
VHGNYFAPKYYSIINQSEKAQNKHSPEFEYYIYEIISCKENGSLLM